MRVAAGLALWLVLAGASCDAPARYQRVPVPSTPFTGKKLDVDEAICAEKGKALACEQVGVTTDCWCDPR